MKETNLMAVTPSNLTIFKNSFTAAQKTKFNS